MVQFGDVALAFLSAVIPFYLGLLAFRGSAFKKYGHAMAALALGITFYFFLDPIRDTNGLGGFAPNPGAEQIVLIAAFTGTFVLLAFLKGQGESFPIWVVATGIAIHSFAEVSQLAGTVPLYFANFAATLPSEVAFVAHKFLEGVVLAAYGVSSGKSNLRSVSLGVSPVVLVFLAGALASLFPPFDLGPLLASAAGGWMLVVVALGLRLRGGDRPWVIAMVAVGFVIVYSVGLLHSS